MRWPWKRRSPKVAHWKVDPDDETTNAALDAFMDKPLRGDFDSPEQALAVNEAWKTGKAVMVTYDDQGKLRVRHSETCCCHHTEGLPDISVCPSCPTHGDG